MRDDQGGGKHPAWRSRRVVVGATVAVVAVVGLVVASLSIGGSASKAAGPGAAHARPVVPAADGSCPDPGRATPVVFVHGLNSQPSDFTSYGNPSLASALTDLPGVSASYFDYHAYSLDWVTNPHIGPALAADISCLADTSAADGGPGRVVVVTHSMGGLALRSAAAETVAGRSVASRIGLAVTIAAPNTGSWIDGVVSPVTHGLVAGTGGSDFSQLVATQIELLAQRSCAGPSHDPAVLAGLIEMCGLLASAGSAAGLAMVPGSAQLAALPPLPVTVPLYAVAGDIEVTTPPLRVGPLAVTVPLPVDVGDLLVKPDSALAEVGHVGPFSGSYTDRCTENLADLGTTQVDRSGWAGCEHGGLLYDPKVIAVVTADVERYLTSVT